MTPDPFEQFQGDVVGRMSSCPFFAPISIIREDTGLTESDLEDSMKVTTVKNGKLGAAVIVFQPEEVIKNPDAPGPEVDVSMLVRALEMPTLNRDTANNGTGISARRMATKIVKLFHQIQHGPTTVLAVRAGRYNDGEGTIGYNVMLILRMNLHPEKRITNPKITSASGTVTILCNNAGVAIYYTTDGSYPDYGSSTFYTGPFAAAENTLIRAVAYPPANSAPPEASGLSQVGWIPIIPDPPSSNFLGEDGSPLLNEDGAPILPEA